MKIRTLLLLLFLCAAVEAQQPAQPPAVRSPEVSADRRVTFRVRAPDASKVTVFCECLTSEPSLTKGTDGVWSVTVGPIEPDIYEYHFTVDGIDNLDQRNPVVKYNSRPNLIESVVDVPAAAPMFYDVKPVPHGIVSMRYYPSKATGGVRRAFVYTPPNYERSNWTSASSVLAARRGWRRIGVDAVRPGQSDSRQPDRREESGANGRRHALRVCISMACRRCERQAARGFRKGSG